MALQKASRLYHHKGLTNILPDIGPRAEHICSSPSSREVQGWSRNEIGPAAVQLELAARGYRLTRGQVLNGAWRIVERVASPNCARKRRGVVQFSWELAEGSA
ncbi:hypothetical protein Taro_043294 [Colocasia esculenta]|uniref:Uncharacterized protein n=1 Tax=Colocasia esculenta TaxID=4460 RepID=A0A843WRR0_COLES|nr:hypothetical protein [Colocasia esculenta]